MKPLKPMQPHLSLFNCITCGSPPLTEGRRGLAVLVCHVAGVLAVPLGGDVPAVLLFVYLG